MRVVLAAGAWANWGAASLRRPALAASSGQSCAPAKIAWSLAA